MIQIRTQYIIRVNAQINIPLSLKPLTSNLIPHFKFQNHENKNQT